MEREDAISESHQIGSEIADSDSESREDEVNELLSVSHVKLNATPYPPCNGKKITLDNKYELEKKTYLLFDPLEERTGKLVSQMFYKLPGGTKFFLVTKRIPIKQDDSILTIATEKYPPSWHMAFSLLRIFSGFKREDETRRLCEDRPTKKGYL